MPFSRTMPTEICEIFPAGEHLHTIILLHGRGSNGEEFSEELFESQLSDGGFIRDILSNFKWVFPNARNIPSAPFDENMLQWFNTWYVCSLSYLDCWFEICPQLRCRGIAIASNRYPRQNRLNTSQSLLCRETVTFKKSHFILHYAANAMSTWLKKP